MPSAWLLDTNIELRMSNSADPQNATIVQVLKSLSYSQDRLCFTSQILGEFWNVSTRPQNQNGFGLTVAQTSRLASVMERDFELLPDSLASHSRWRDLLEEHEIKGVQVHDTRLAAAMYVHGITNLLTFNLRDFERFTGLQAIDPIQWLRHQQL
jgi:predicted nucleic acid-binding protein